MEFLGEFFHEYAVKPFTAGVGALVVRKDALELLGRGKAYFGGGTVEASLAEGHFFR